MIGVALVLAIQAAAPPAGFRGNLTMDMTLEPATVAATASGDGDLTVTAKRVYRARMATYTDRPTRTRRCRQKGLIGIASLDASLCDTLLACMTRSATRELVKTCVAGAVAAEVRRLKEAGHLP